MSDLFGQQLKASIKGDHRTFAQLLTSIDDLGVKALKDPKILEPKQKAFRIGITGPPGAGKSTLVGQLLPRLSALDLRVGVLAVDPSSPFSSGAILGDRIRYNQMGLDPNIFIRSIGSRGSLGGLTGSAYLMLRAFDAAHFDVVIVETVGVGQTELEIMHVADHLAVVLVPESGDSVQAMKAGLMEIADLFVVNKADRPGADALARELEFVAESTPPPRSAAKILQATSTIGSGVTEILEYFISVMKGSAWKQNRSSAIRLQQEGLALARPGFEAALLKKLRGVKTNRDMARALKVIGS